MLVDDVSGNCTEDIAEISRGNPEQIAAELAAWHWLPEAPDCRGYRHLPRLTSPPKAGGLTHPCHVRFTCDNTASS